MDDIVQQGHPALHRDADYIPLTEINSPRIMAVIEKMKHSLATQHDGVALAAPQIGESLQLFVVTPRIFDDAKEYQQVFINPEILNTSHKTKWLDEGCLSCRWKVGQVERATSVTLRAYDEQGNLSEITAHGLLAHIFQHETDHLRGVLFLEKARNLRDMTAEEIEESQNWEI